MDSPSIQRQFIATKAEQHFRQGLIHDPHHQGYSPHHPEVDLRANLGSISHSCHFFEVVCVWELTKKAICLPLSCLQGGA